MKTPEEHTAEKKIGCVQHDCDECKQREKLRARLAGRTTPTIEQMRDELTPNLIEEHTAAVEIHGCHGGEDATNPDAVGVPDLIERLMFRGQFPVDKLREEAATALAALQAECDALKAMCEELADAYLALLALGYKDTGALSKWQEMRDEATK